jgi:hypothetical protein
MVVNATVEDSSAGSRNGTAAPNERTTVGKVDGLA